MGRNRDAERRKAKRVEYPYIMRVRQSNPIIASKTWELVIVKNISKAGIIFHSEKLYEVGSELEIHFKNPLHMRENKCLATVVRSEDLGKGKYFYGTAVTINKIDDRESFDKVIDFVIKKKKI